MSKQFLKQIKPTTRKPVLVKSELHRRLKLIAFDYDVKLQDLVDVIIETALSDKARIKEILKELNVENS